MMNNISILVLLGMLVSCSKVNNSNIIDDGDILIGNYSGSLQLYGSTERYHAIITKSEALTYMIETEFPDPIPALKIKLALSQGDLLYLTIPPQVINNQTYRGGSGVGIAYDAFFSKGNQRLYLTIQKDGDPDLIVFDAVKLP